MALYNKNTMKKYLYLVPVIGLSLCSGATAQGLYGYDPSVKDEVPVYRSFDAIKRDIASLLKENHRLEDRYRDIQAQYTDVKDAYEQKRATADQIRHESGIILQKDKNNQYQVQSIHGNVETLKNEILIKKSKISYLQGQILLMEDKQALWETQLKDLNNKQRQAQINGASDRFSVEDRINYQKKEIARLQKEIGLLNEKRDMLFRRYKMIQTDGSVVELKKHNEMLRKKISILEKERDLLHREEAFLQKKQKIVRRKVPGSIGYNEEYEKELSREVARLEERYRNLNATLQNKVNRANQYQTLSKEFVEASKANQQLRQKLSELQ